MKRIFTLLFVISGFYLTNAQISKGSLLLDGQFSLGTTVGENNNIFSTGISPSAGLFISDRLVLGTGIGIGYVSVSDAGGGNITLSPFVRYYLSNKADSPWKWFASTRAGFSFPFGDADGDPIYLFEAGTGVNYFFNNNVALETSLLYLNDNLENSSRSSSLVLAMGIRFFLNPNSETSGEGLSIIKSNKFFIGSSMASFSTGLSARGDVSSINISPRIGWFVSEKWALGSSLTLNYSSNNFFNGLGLGVSPFARFYPQNSNGPLQWFLTAEIGLLYTSNEFDDAVTGGIDFNSKGWLKNFRTGAGLNWFLNEQVALEGILSYQYNESSTLPSIERAIGFNVGFQFFLSR